MADEAAAVTETSDETPPKVKKSGLVVMLAAAVASLAVGGGVGAYGVGPRLAGGDAAGGDAADAHGAPASGGHGAPAQSSPIYEMDNLVVNPAGTHGERFLIVTVAVEVSSNSLVETLNAHDAEIRDRVLHMLASRTVEQLNDLSVRDELKAEVRKTIESLIGVADVHNIFLPMFVLQ